jgi:DNA-binding helix-hairpin-helix protein with protein kinase domain
MGRYEEVRTGQTHSRRQRELIEEQISDEEEQYDKEAFRQYLQHKRKVQLDANGLRIVKKSELKAVMKSKIDVYNILTKEGQLYLPPYSECPMQFINDIMMSKKKVNTLNAFLNSSIHVGLQECRNQDDRCAFLR